jgi:hypothetical protein
MVAWTGVIMSTMGGGGGSPEFDKLIQLATFVQGTGYLDRVKDLQALEASSKDALEKANEAVAAAGVAQDTLDKREAVVKKREDDLADAQAAHEARVQALTDALAKARK